MGRGFRDSYPRQKGLGHRFNFRSILMTPLRSRTVEQESLAHSRRTRAVATAV
jgi:hypothetical protein